MTDIRNAEVGAECALTIEDAQLLLHDLRAPMTAIVGYASMLRRVVDGEERERIVDGLERAVARMDEMLAAASRGEFKTGALRTSTRRFDLCALAHEAIDDLLASSALEIRLDCPDEAAVSGDPLLVRRALDNLLSNAVRYGRGEPIDVHLEAGATTVAIEVSDRGPGIPEAERERVLRPLERLERDAATPGTGLGLSVVASVAEAHRGRVSVLGRDGGGTTVRLELPIG